MRDQKGQLLATVQYRFEWFPFGSTFYDFKDKKGKLIGSVEREMINSFFYWGTFYNIRDREGNKIGEFKSQSFSSPPSFFNQEGEQIGFMHNVSGFFERNNWKI